MPAPRFEANRTALLVVDVQEKLFPLIHDGQRMLQQIGRLVDGACALQTPVLVTEQYRKGLGNTVPQLDAKLGDALCREEKLKFSACIDPVRRILSERNVGSVIVCGIEAHVCVLQTCLDLLDIGFLAAVAVDAVSSRNPVDKTVAMDRLRQAGVVPVTVESVLMEMVHEAGTDRFKKILPIIK